MHIQCGIGLAQTNGTRCGWLACEVSTVPTPHTHHTHAANKTQSPSPPPAHIAPPSHQRKKDPLMMHANSSSMLSTRKLRGRWMGVVRWGEDRWDEEFGEQEGRAKQ